MMRHELAGAASGTCAAMCGGSSTPGQLLHRHTFFSLSAMALYTPGTCLPHPPHDVFPHLLHPTE